MLTGGPAVVLNVCKAIVAVMLAKFSLGSPMATLIAGLFVVFGHTWPFLGFLPRQKGIAVVIGAMSPVAPVPVAAMMGLWVVFFALTRYASVSWVASFGVLPIILYFIGRRDIFVIYGILMSAMAVIQMAGGLARISEGKVVRRDDEGPFVDEGDEEDRDDEDEPVKRKRTGLRVAAGIVAVLSSALWFGNRCVYRGFGRQPDVIRSGCSDLMVVALTFDDGPDPKYTPQILDILRRSDVKATFFMVGKHVERFPDVAKRVAQEGHCVGSHSYSHVNMPFLGQAKVVSEVKKAEEAIQNACGIRPHLFRPPRGLASVVTRKVLHDEGYTMVLWRLSSRDWAEPSWREIVSTCNHARNGDIILFHDSGSLVSSEGGSRDNTVKALPIVIKNLRDRGFRFVTIDEMIEIWNREKGIEATD